MEIKIYGSSNRSTNQSRKWFKEQNIPFVYRDITKQPLEMQEMQEILRMTDHGTDEIIATKSNIYKELQVDFDTIPLKQMFDFIYRFPRLLKQPVIVGINKLQVGFDQHEIRQFIPRAERKKFLSDKLALNP